MSQPVARAGHSDAHVKRQGLSTETAWHGRFRDHQPCELQRPHRVKGNNVLYFFLRTYTALEVPWKDDC